MYCVIDIGSNTIRLVIYRMEGGKFRSILNNKHTAGLAGLVDKKNCLTQEGIDRLVRVLKDFKEVLSILPGCPVYLFATASLRNVVNTDHVLEIVRQETGFEIRLLSGYEEAMLDYRGALRHLGEDSGLLIDIGGGSTELVFFKNKTVLAAHSFPVGSLNLHRRFVKGVLPEKKELKAMRQEVLNVIGAQLPPSKEYVAEPMCGVGGTARAALKLFQHLRKDGGSEPVYDAAFFEKVLEQAEDAPYKLMRHILKISPERVHTLVPGILVFSIVAGLYGGKTVRTSPYGVREGYLAYMLEKEGKRCD